MTRARRARAIGLLVALVTGLGVAWPSAAQQDLDSAERIDPSSWRSFVAATEAPLGADSPEYREAFARAAIESLTVRAAWEQLQLDYERKRLAQRAETFAWQQTSTRLIFWLVTLVVVTGLALSFWHVLRQESSPTKLLIGEKGIELSSRLVGVLIFVLSLAFFYLYLENVYPITELGAASAADAGAGARDRE